MHRHTHSHVHHGLPFSVSPCTQRTCLSSCLSTPWSRPSFWVFEPHTVRPGRLKVSVRLSLCSSWSLISQCLQSSNGIWNGWEPCRAHVQWQFEAINVIVSGVKKSNMAFPVVCVCVLRERIGKGFWGRGKCCSYCTPKYTYTHMYQRSRIFRSCTFLHRKTLQSFFYPLFFYSTSNILPSPFPACLAYSVWVPFLCLFLHPSFSLFLSSLPITDSSLSHLLRYISAIFCFLFLHVTHVARKAWWL